MPELEVTVFDKGEKRCTHVFSGRFEVGRQRREVFCVVVTFQFKTLTELHAAVDRVYRLAVSLPDEPLTRVEMREKFLLVTDHCDRRAMAAMFDRLQNLENETTLDWIGV